MREFSSGQIKKGVRSIGFGGDGATWGNYSLVWRDADTALVDYGDTHYTNGNDFHFEAVGLTSPSLWHGLTIYVIAMEKCPAARQRRGQGAGAEDRRVEDHSLTVVARTEPRARSGRYTRSIARNSWMWGCSDFSRSATSPK